MARKTPTASTIKYLLALSGNECAFPDCDHKLFNSEGTYISQLCHIEAAEIGGERYNKQQTDEERRSASNLIFMCHAHHKVTDNIDKYTVEVLKDIKKKHESKFINNTYSVRDEQVDQIVDKIFEGVTTIIDQNRQTHEMLSKLTQDVSLSRNFNPIIDNKDIYSENLKIGLKLRQDNKLMAALNFYLEFEKKDWYTLSEVVKFKLLANIGVTYLDLGEKKDAAQYFLKIGDLVYESLDTLSYICMGYAILDDEQKFNHYFEKALKIGDGNENLWSAFLLINGKTISTEKVKSRIPSKFLKSDFIIIKLIELFNKEGDISASQELMWQIEAKLLSDNYKEWQIISAYTGILVGTILTVEKLQLNHFSKQELVKIEQAFNLYSRIIKLFNNSEAPKILSNIYFNRALCLTALLRTDERDEDFETAWNLHKSHSTFKGLFQIYLRQKSLSKCRRLLQKWKTNSMIPDEEFETFVCEARLLCLLEETQNLEDATLEIYNKSTITYKPLVLDVFINNLLMLEEYDLVRKYSEKLIQEFPNYVFGYIGLYVVNRRENNRSEALWALRQTEGKDYDKTSEISLLMQIGHGYFQFGEYRSALSTFEKLGEFKLSPNVKDLVAECYFRLKDYKTVVEFKLESFAGIQLLFWSYKELKSFDEAERILLLGMMREKTTEADLFRKNGAFFYHERKKNQKSKDCILSISNLSHLKVEEAVDLSGLLLSMGYKSEAFELAYKIRVMFYDNFEVHDYFVHLWLRYEKFFSVIFLTSVSDNSMVILKDEGGIESKYYLNIDNEISDGLKLDKRDALWNILLGQQKGAKINIPNTIGNFYIIEIWSNVLTSFRDSLFLLQTKYVSKSNIYFAKLN